MRTTRLVHPDQRRPVGQQAGQLTTSTWPWDGLPSTAACSKPVKSWTLGTPSSHSLACSAVPQAPAQPAWAEDFGHGPRAPGWAGMGPVLQKATGAAARQPLPPMGPSPWAGPPHLARAAGSSVSERLCWPSPGRGYSHGHHRCRHPQASASWRHHSARLTPKQIPASHGAGRRRARESGLRGWLLSDPVLPINVLGTGSFSFPGGSESLYLQASQP